MKPKANRIGNLPPRSRNLLVWMPIDFLINLSAYCVAFLGRAVTAPFLDLGHSFPIILLASLTMLAALYVGGVYRRLWSQSSGHSLNVILHPVMIMTAMLSIIDFSFWPRPLPISVIVFGGAFAFGGLVAVRYRSRLISGLSWRWRAVWHQEFPDSFTRVLIVGAGESGQDLAWRLMHQFRSNSYRIIGFIDDDTNKHQMYVEGCPVLGGRQDIERIADERAIDLIVLAVHNIAGADFREIVSLCENTQARIKVIPDLFELVRNPHHEVPLRDVQPEDLLGRSVVTRHKDVDLSPVTHKTVLITGAAGSIGSELSRQILSYNPVKVILLDNNESGLHDLHVELHAQHPQVDLVPALVDIASLEPVRTQFKKHRPQIVFHAAAYKHVPMLEYYPQEALRVNITGTMNLAEMALDYDVERFVLVSTDKAVKPSSIMGASKRVGELFLHALSTEGESSTRFTAVRFGNVLGSRGSVIPTFNRQIDNGGPVTVTHRDMTRYFMSIPEAVNLIIHAACMTDGDEIFVLKMGEVVHIVDLAERMIRLRGLRPYKDVEITFTGVRPGEKMHEELYYDEENPVETIHPNIVKLHNWPGKFVSEHFYDQVMKTVARNQETDAAVILDQLLHIIEPPDSLIDHDGKVSRTIAL